MKTYLISGAGNTFHIAWDYPKFNQQQQIKAVQEMCLNHPADGFIYLKKKEGIFSWEFYNRDQQKHFSLKLYQVKLALKP
jgi:hypothetical protein